jgi:FtsP/CotA-like multicopper oxidase with cupredoxin domain
MLGSGEPLRVKPSERVLFHILNSSPTEVHTLSLPGHTFHVLALDGNPVPTPATVEILRLCPAERVSAIVTMDHPGIWILGEIHRQLREAGMGIVLEYANATGDPQWNPPADLTWDYQRFASPGAAPPSSAQPIQLVFDSKFQGHGSPERWTINGQSYPKTPQPTLQLGQRYRLVMQNKSTDEHPIHLHRHTFEVRRLGPAPELHGLHKDTVLIPAKSTSEIEFTANLPGPTLLHCHQQDHMDRGFMMLFHTA